jgi:hypothetical protein
MIHPDLFQNGGLQGTDDTVVQLIAIPCNSTFIEINFKKREPLMATSMLLTGKADCTTAPVESRKTDHNYVNAG